MKTLTPRPVRRELAGGAGMLVLVAIVLVLLVGGGCTVSTYNGLVKMDEEVQGAYSQVDNQYKRRSDLIPQLVQTVKGSASYEEGVLTEVTAMRAKVGTATLPEDPAARSEYLQNQQALGGALSRLLVVAEKYPDLKASAGFLDLQSQIEGTENRIATARKDLIDAVKTYNSKIRGFPGNWIGGLAGLEKQEQPEIGSTADREVPTIDFGNDE